MTASGTGATGARNTSAIEVARFDALAGRWWDPRGPMRPLHEMNPLRVGWIAQRIVRRFPDPGALRLLDVGCGAGLAAEALARRGYDVLGIDSAAAAIQAARDHGEGQGLRLAYWTCDPEALAGERFGAITALEVIEHVPDPGRFVRTLAGLLAPGGLLFLSTLNRTPRAFVTAKLGAEYVLGLLPRGTHDWRRFIRPAELGGLLRTAGLRVNDIAGMTPDLLGGGWRTSRDLAVNYIVAAAAA